MRKKTDIQNVVKGIVIVAAVTYFLFLTYRAVSYNYRTNKKITSLEDEIILLESEEEYLKDLNVYYETDTYKELEARRKLGLKKAGETVIKIPVDQDRLSQIERRDVIQKVIDTNEESAQEEEGMSNPEKWLHFVLRI